MQRLPSLQSLRCDSCATGAAFRHGRGGFCPLLPRVLEKGDYLYREGDGGDYLWLVREGAVELVSGVHTLGVRTSGMFVGSEALCVGRFLSGAVALSRVRLCGIPGTEWKARALGSARDGVHDEVVWMAPALRVRAEAAARSWGRTEPPF